MTPNYAISAAVMSTLVVKRLAGKEIFIKRTKGYLNSMRQFFNEAGYMKWRPLSYSRFP